MDVIIQENHNKLADRWLKQKLTMQSFAVL